MATYRPNTPKINPVLTTQPVSSGVNPAKAAASLLAGGSQAKTGGAGRSGGSSGGSSGDGESAAAPAEPVDYGAALGDYFNEMVDTYTPEPLAYEQLGEEQLKTSIAGWLRPAYDRAILERRERTETYGAELDADAISRGMGASTYVTDVKRRQQKDEARDVALLESEYGATLAKYVSERLENEKDRALETDMFNREQEMYAYDMAYDAAMVLFSMAYGGGGGGGRSSGGRTRRSYGGSSGTSTGSMTTRDNVELFLSGLTGAQRGEVYAGATAEGAAYRDEIINSVGLSGYFEMVEKYAYAP